MMLTRSTTSPFDTPSLRTSLLHTPLLRTTLFSLLCTLAIALPLTASAQWQWLDKGGRKVFSDQAPPLDVPDKKILKRPSGMPISMPSASASSSDATAAPTPTSAPKVSNKDTALEKKKAQTEAVEADKKKAEEQRVAAAKVDNCARAKQALASLQSGVRIAQINAQGEREFMSDEARQVETQRVQGIAGSDCQ